MVKVGVRSVQYWACSTAPEQSNKRPESYAPVQTPLRKPLQHNIVQTPLGLQLADGIDWQYRARV